MSREKIKVLVMIDWYLPGYKAGGPIRSVANLVAALGDRCDFSIVTSDRDYGEKKHYAEIEANTWIESGENCRVWYCSRDKHGYQNFRHLIANTDYDVLYLNSMFSLRYTIFPLWNARSIKPDTAVVLAPRGMLHAGAMAFKTRKKKFFLWLMRRIGAHKHIHFQATDAQESADIRQYFGEDVQISEVPNLPRLAQPQFAPLAKHPGQLRLIFLSRISEKKGVHFLLEQLKTQSASVHLDLYGPDEEPGYWDRCQAIIDTLPPQIHVRKHAPVLPEAIPALVQGYHAFAMPTAGENFGHAIFEALAAGRPVVLSDQHPWQGLEAAKAGFSVPLDKPAQYADALRRMAAMDDAEYQTWAQGAYAYAQSYLADAALVQPMFDLLAAPALTTAAE